MSYHVWIDAHGPLAETAKALKFETENGETWIPKSVIGARKKKGDSVTRLELQRWWAEKEGLADPDDRKDLW